MGTGWAGEGRWCRGKISLTAKKNNGKTKFFRSKRKGREVDPGIMASILTGLNLTMHRVPFYRLIYRPSGNR